MRRFRELDGLRGIAALAVVVYHFSFAYQSRYVGAPPPLFTAAWGQYGVQLFFLISGFVVLMSARSARKTSDFVISRVTRLYPAYWVALALAVVLAAMFAIPDVPLDLTTVATNLTMVQRWFMVPNVDDVYWTLAVEMQFYVLLFALLVATGNRVTDRLVVWVAGIWTGIGVLVALVVFPMSHDLEPQMVPTIGKILINSSLAEYAPLFCTGMLLFVSRSRGRLHPLLVLTASAAVINAGLIETWERAAWVAVMIFAFTVVVVREQTPILTVRPLQWLGLISFSLYLTHTFTGFVVINSLLKYGHLSRDVADFIALAVALLVAWGVYEVAEKRLSRASRRWLSARRDRPQPAAETQ